MRGKRRRMSRKSIIIKPQHKECESFYRRLLIEQRAQSRFCHILAFNYPKCKQNTHAQACTLLRACTQQHRKTIAHIPALTRTLTLFKFNVLSLYMATWFLVCTHPWQDHYFTLEACVIRILTSSLLNILMFNSIIITYFIPLADGKDEVCCNVMLQGPLWMQAEICQLFPFYFWPNKSKCIC